MQSSPTNEESIEQDRGQNSQVKGPLAQAGQTRSTAARGPLAYLRLTLPFAPYADTEAAPGISTGPFGLLRRVRLISYSDVKGNTPLASASIPEEDIVDADTIPALDSLAPIALWEERTQPSRIARHDLASLVTEEPVTLLDSAMMFSVRPSGSGLGHSDILVDTLIEDITKQATLSLPRIPGAAKKADQVEAHKDITATAGGAAIAGISDLSSGVLRYVTNVAMTHLVSPHVYGIFGEVYTVTLILAFIAKLGFDGVLVRLLPAYRVKDERNLASGLTHSATWVTLISGMVIGVLFFAFAAVIARLIYHDPSYSLPIQEVAPLIPLIALQLLFASGLQAFKEIKWKVCVDRLSQPVITLLALVIFYLLGWRLEALTFSAIVGFICSVILGQIALSKVAKRFTGDTPPRYTPLVWTGYAIPMLFSGLVFGISNSTDILFLSIFSTSTQAGIYIAADRVSNFVATPLFALNMIFFPLIGEYYASGKHERLASMFKLVTKWSILFSLPVFLCCLVFHDAILGVFGPTYTDGGLVLIILCFGNLVDAGTGSVLQLLVITGRIRIILINSIIGIMVNVGLSFMLVQYFGILGAALAAALTVIIVNGLCLIEVYWFMKIHPYRWDICKPLLAGGVAYLVAVLLLHFIHFASGYLAIIEELSLIIPFVLVYVLVMGLLRFSEEDQIVFDAVLAKFGKQRSSGKM